MYMYVSQGYITAKMNMTKMLLIILQLDNYWPICHDFVFADSQIDVVLINDVTTAVVAFICFQKWYQNSSRYAHLGFFSRYIL